MIYREFKIEVVKQVTERGHSVERQGISVKSLYDWRAKYGQDDKTNKSSEDRLRLVKLEAELKRVKEERDILKKAAKYFADESE